MIYKKSDPNTPRSVSSQYLDVKQSGVMAAGNRALNPMGDSPFAKLIDQIADLGDKASAETAIRQVYILRAQYTKIGSQGEPDLSEAAGQINGGIGNLRAISVKLADAASRIFAEPIPGLSKEIQDQLRSNLD